MKTDEIEKATHDEYQQAMIEMVTKILTCVDGHDALFGMQALMGALANVIIDAAPDEEAATHALMGLSISAVHGVKKAFTMMADEERLEGEETATHEVPFRMQ